ncbi:Pseudouridine synthase [Azospirillaceae bacterium]
MNHGLLEPCAPDNHVDGRRVKLENAWNPGRRYDSAQMVDAKATETTIGARNRSKSETRNERHSVCAQSCAVSRRFFDREACTWQQGAATRHLDGMLDGLQVEASERPRLVHRLDKETSGVLLLARNVKAASALAEAFRTRNAHKLYWALTVGAPRPLQGRIDAPLIKAVERGGERMVVNNEKGQPATSLYRVLDHVGKQAAWVAVEPLTGRTHQIRVHLAAIGTPIVGDAKYGGSESDVSSMELARGLHLHARRLCLPHPRRGVIDVSAPLSSQLLVSWKNLGFDVSDPEASALLDQ